MTDDIVGINTDYFNRCIATLESAFAEWERRPAAVTRDIFRAACVKEFEIILKQSAILLKKRLGEFSASNKEVAALSFKDVFRRAAKHALMETAAVERWFDYRDCRNNAAHEYGENFAEDIMRLLPGFVADAKSLSSAVDGGGGDG